MGKKLRKKAKTIISRSAKIGTAGKTVIKKTLISPASKAGKVAVKVSGKISDKYKKSPLKPKVDKTVLAIDETLDKTGVKAKAKKAKKQLDTFTGTRQFRLMQKRMALQQRYNDILATKLEEALQRIERLENMVEQKGNK